MPKDAHHDKISFTALSVAYLRSFSGIPYSREIFEELGKLRKQSGTKLLGGTENNGIIAQVEARYNLINKFLIEGKYSQVFEIASGLSPRGLEFTQSKKVIFVELDLPSILRQKNLIIGQLVKKGLTARLPNLYLEPGNALSLSDLEKACLHFQKGKPVAIIAEGLLSYLTFEEKTQVAKNILTLLKRTGGVWLTSDTQDKSNRPEFMKKINADVSKITGSDKEKNYFIDQNHAISFFSDLGFKVERHSLSEISSKLITLKHFSLTKEQIEQYLKQRYVFVMEPKNSAMGSLRKEF